MEDNKIDLETVPASQDRAGYESASEVDVSEMNGGSVPDERARVRRIRKDEIVRSLRTIEDGTYQTPESYRIVPDDEDLEEPKEIEDSVREHIISTKTLIVLCFLFAGAGIGIKFVYDAQQKRLRAACGLLQKGQPLPDSPDEVQMPDADSLYKLVEICEQNHEVDITYGCAAKGVLHTAGLNHEPSEISEELRLEALRVAEEVRCDY